MQDGEASLSLSRRHISEFQRIRLQYTHTMASDRSPDDAFFLQWTAIIGSHVHSFRDR